jgi:hypothetical protein
LDRWLISDFESMMDWPVHLVGTLQKLIPGNVLGHLAARMRNLSYSTSFSGVDAPGTSLAMLVATITAMLPGTHLRDALHLHACESYSESQAELLLHPSRPCHIYPNILHFFSDSVAKKIAELEKSTALSMDDFEPIVRSPSSFGSSSVPCLICSKVDEKVPEVHEPALKRQRCSAASHSLPVHACQLRLQARPIGR